MPTNKDIQAARVAAVEQGLNPETLKTYKEWETPTAEDIRLILSIAGLSGAGAGALTGVEGRTVRRWTGGDSTIPYACWALIVSYAGLGNIWVNQY